MRLRTAGSCVALIAMAFAAAVARGQMFPINLADSDSKSDPNVKLPVYDVASVKENKSGDHMMRIMNQPDGFSCTNISLKTLLGNAYGIRQDLISGGPGWVDSTGFDVEARVAPEDVEAFKTLTGRQRNSLLQAMLEERFHLTVHHETKVLPIYDLVVAKGGSKLQPVSAEDKPGDVGPIAPKGFAEGKVPRGGMTLGPGMFRGEALSMQAVANQLSYIVHYTVVNKTGLTGSFNLDLKWAPDEGGAAAGDSSGDAAVSIFTAVQEQLGLKLQATKGPTDTIAIDHVEMPTTN
jgi:uncharacterized protein (TIGR03435 family)